MSGLLADQTSRHSGAHCKGLTLLDWLIVWSVNVIDTPHEYKGLAVSDIFSPWDQITDEQRELQERARRFVDEWCIPYEVEAERLGGKLPADIKAKIRDAGIAARLHGGRHAVEDGGQGWSTLEYMLVEEQYGRSTNGVSWVVPNGYNVLAMGTPEQKAEHLAPSLTGEKHLSYAVTEADAGSDPSGIATIARRDGDDWIINGEKWFVTSGDHASVAHRRCTHQRRAGQPRHHSVHRACGCTRSTHRRGPTLHP